MRILLMSVVLYAVCGSVLAGTWSDGPHLGYVDGEDIEDGGLAAGWQVAYAWNDLVSIEGTVSWFQDELGGEIGTLSFPDDFVTDLDVAVLGVTLNIGGWLLPDRLYMAGGAGGGLYSFTTDEEKVLEAADQRLLRFEVDMHDSIGWHLELKSEVVLSERWSLLAAWRQVMLDVDATVTAEDRMPPWRSRGPEETEIAYNHSLLRLGVQYRF